jgi:hypothetical protein
VVSLSLLVCQRDGVKEVVFEKTKQEFECYWKFNNAVDWSRCVVEQSGEYQRFQDHEAVQQNAKCKMQNA